MMETLISRLQERLDSRNDAKTRAWWEAYMKGVIPFRGVKMEAIRQELHAWLAAEGIAQLLSGEEQKALALSLFRESCSEDKLAGVLYFAEVLVPCGLVDWRADLPRLGALFVEGHIYEWGTCDWLCVKVLGPLAAREGPECARAISEWRRADNMWQRRAAGVAFVNLAPRGEANFPGFTDMLLETCAATVRDPQRFAQTGTGWVLRELSRAEPERVAAFVSDNIGYLSREAFNYATARLPDEVKSALKERIGKPDAKRAQLKPRPGSVAAQ
ncbi:MAG TPA: DNA alkylation repair protein [Chloroflexia bacterium]|nr:DNA alkylation repair protein [Chloroflexia bacterium]